MATTVPVIATTKDIEPQNSPVVFAKHPDDTSDDSSTPSQSSNIQDPIFFARI